MTTVKSVAFGVLLASLLTLCGYVGIQRYGAAQYAAGRADLLAAQQSAAARLQAEAAERAARAAKAAGQAMQAGAVAVAASNDAQQRDVTVITRYIHDSPSPVVCAMRDDDPVLQDLRAAATRADASADDLVRGKSPKGENPAPLPQPGRSQGMGENDDGHLRAGEP